MLRLAIACALIWVCAAQIQTDLLITEKNVLSPPYFNIATGKKIDSTASCGTEGPEEFCKLTGGTNFEFSSTRHQGQVCDICSANQPEKAHLPKNAIDGTEKWWQSPPLSRGNEFNKVNVTIHLGQVFHVAYVLIKFANSPRAGTWVLERSSDHGATFQPWQYFANTDSDCYNLFGMDSLEEITRDDSVICTSDYSGVVPLENGEVIVSMIKGRPGSHNFSYATVLQEWSKATDVRLRFLRTKTLLGHLMAVSEQDPTVTRRYYYSIKDISIGGRCVCNGHADTCVSDPLDLYKLKCECRHNTCGDSCEFCCPGFEQKAWKAAVPESTNKCEACNCHGHSTSCRYDEEVAQRRLSLDRQGNYEGGGVCMNCTHNTAGINCEQCAVRYWRPEEVDPRDPYGCRPCDCDSAYTIGSCEPNTGRCYCKVQYAGDRCDRCAPGYQEFPECRPCDCYYNGTVDEVCVPVGDGSCPCKYNFAGKYCRECAAGFYNFPKCDVCECQGAGVASDVCDLYTGDCPCSDGFTGSSCNQCAKGYYNYPLCQRCPCSDIATTEDVCDPVTGECFCRDTFAGQSCDDCKPGFFGFPLCRECQCTAPGSVDNTCDSQSGRCDCKSNYGGDHCDECAAEYYGYPNCDDCACDLRGSLKTTCDPMTGQCLCRENIGGTRCDRCLTDYFNFPRCEECSCDARGIVSLVPGVCLAFTAGQCECKENVMGKNCDMCKPLHYDLERGCVSCNCFIQGTLDGVADCGREDGQCWCRPYTCTQRCSQCENGFYGLEELNYFGCTSCECDVGGAMTEQCDKNTGQCTCKVGIGGRRCSRALDRYYYPTLYQNQYEAEDGRTPDNSILRFGFNSDRFPTFSMRGYAEFSIVQPAIVMHVNVESHNLYRVLVRYHNPTAAPITGKVSLVMRSEGEGHATASDRATDCLDCVEQSFQVTFDATSEPRMITVQNPFVLNRGTWNVVMEAEPGLLVDYLVLLPSEYYEPGILEQSTTKPCVPTETPSDEECVQFTHPSLAAFTTVDLTADASIARLGSPTTAHPEMVSVDSTTGNAEDSSFSANINLPKAGKYVLVLEYASTENRFQKARITVTDGSSNTYTNTKFNIYSCPYSFLCRQVALGVLNEVQVFEMSLPVMRVTVETDSGTSFYIKSLTAIPMEEWTMELVEPKARCITTASPEFDQCITSSYEIPVSASKFDVPPSESTSVNGEEPAPPVLPDTMTDSSVDLVYLDGAEGSGTGNTALQIPMELKPGRYVFLVHFYNPDHTSFSPRVVVDGGVASTGTANITFCPFAEGCRAVVTTDDGRIVIDITVPTTTFTMTVPEGKAFWVQYVLAVPEEDYDADLLDIAPIDKSSDFIRQCSTDAQSSFYSTLENPTDFCKESVFSLTVNYNNGGIDCSCSGAGTVGGGDAICADYGGQCPCKPNVIGRQCDRCMTGFFGYPNCRPCDCNGLLCDGVSGECICPPNTRQPACDACLPFTHSYHPLAGCVACDCNIQGVTNAADRGCDSETGQCRCKDLVTGPKCDQCAPGYFGFPNCRKCTCDERGRVSEACDASTGQCLCKENVEGLQCDRCKAGSFHLDINNPLGCTECFCFGASSTCHSSQYPATEIYDMTGWRMLNLNNVDPEIVATNDGQTLNVDIAANGGQADPSRPNLYWAAPRTYLGDLVGSYGGELRYTSTWSQGRGDNAGGNSGVANPAPILGPIPDIILKGNSFVIGWTNPAPSAAVNVKLLDQNFQHSSGNPVTRAEMMMVLAELQAVHIRASPIVAVNSVSLQDVVMTTTDYSLEIGSGPSIPSVEECTCPPGYNGRSCQLCDVGHYRDTLGPFLGYCKQCDCYGHCDECGPAGVIQQDDCLHNTGGPNCDVCLDGYIGNATSGEVDSCKPCPCPFPDVEGNFADSCEELDGDVICNCKEGYTGERCEFCAAGYFGNPAVRGGFCQPCNCHGNLDRNLIFTTWEGCDSLTGECMDCMYNTGGKYCEKCADGYYGDALIAKNCTECACDSCGTEVCDHKMGHCSCRPNVVGALCDTCKSGFWNFQSCTGCQRCSCTEGALDVECDERTGQCKCAPNIVGQNCDRCANGFYDYSPEGCKPCKCRNNGPCNPKNGQCECPPGITGPQCDQCKLDRHVLLPGTEECTQCGTCTDDLLNDVEPLTQDVIGAVTRLENVSVGIHAQTRLERLRQNVSSLMDYVNAGENIVSDTNLIVDNWLDISAGAFGDMASGSGESTLETNELNAGKSNELTEAPFNNVENKISQLEVAVSELCNQTTEILLDVKATENRTMAGLDNARALDTAVSDFLVEARDLKDELSSKAPEDDAQYQKKLQEAKKLIEEMSQRDFSDMMSAADDEKQQAEELLTKVESAFVDPAKNATSLVDALSDELMTKHDKMREIRSKLNNATQKVNDANTANAVNGKNLTEMSDAINAINADAEAATGSLTDAEQLLNASKMSINGPIQDGISELDNLAAGLEEVMAELKPAYEQLVDELARVSPLVNQSIAKVAQLVADAAALESIIQNDLNATEPANAYQRIVNAMDDAATAADEAWTAANRTAEDVKGKNLEEEANVAQQRSSNLLSDTQDLEQNKVATLIDDNEAIKINLTAISEDLDNLWSELNTTKKSLAEQEANRGTIDADIAATNAAATKALEIARDVEQQAIDLENQIKLAPDPNVDLQREVVAVSASLDGLPAAIGNMDSEVDRLLNERKRLNMLEKELGMLQKIQEIQKKIALARNVANSVKSTILFTAQPDEANAEYVGLRVPAPVVNTRYDVNLNFMVKVDKTSPDNSLVYLGNRDTTNGDYLALETVNGQVKYHFKVGDGIATLTSDRAIDDGEWHRIRVSRFGNEGRLEVDYSQIGRGDNGNTIGSDVKTGKTDSDNLVSDMAPRAMSFYMGGLPFQPPATMRSRQANACMADVRLKNESVGLWNFKEYSGSKPGTNCLNPSSGLSSNNQEWKFSGLGSYLRIARGDTLFFSNPNSRADFVGFEFKTLQDNSLLFLVGENTEQFMAVEIIDGKFAVSWNFGFPDGPMKAFVENVTDVTQQSKTLIRTGVIPSFQSIAMSVNLRLKLQKKYPQSKPNITGDIWLGGIWQNDVNPAFKSVLQNIGTSFRGCLRNLNFNSRLFNIQHAKENIGVTRGCRKESVQNLKLNGTDSVGIPTGLPNAQNLDGTVIIKSSHPNGMILSAQDGETAEHVTVSLENGKLVVTDGNGRLTSNEFYADGRSHMIHFSRRVDGSMSLVVDNSQPLTSLPTVSDADTELARRRRQSILNTEIINSRVKVYLGGAVNQPMFVGCIGNPIIKGTSLPGSPITKGIQCGTDGVECVGRPVFNGCDTGEPTTEESLSLGPTSALSESSGISRRNPRRRVNGGREASGDVEREIVRPVGLLSNSGFDRECSLSYRPETSGYSYSGDGYSKHYVKRFKPNNWRFSLVMRTYEKRGLIFFMSDTRCNEHISVYLVKGKIAFSVMFGGERSRLKSVARYDDGYWHQVTFERKGNLTQLMLDGSIEGLGEMYSESQTFPLNMPFYVGGLHAVPKNFAANHINRKHLTDFSGCIRDLMVNNREIDTQGLGSGLRINVSPCFEGGFEPGMYIPHQEPGYSSAFMIAMNSYTVGVNVEITLEIKPRKRDGLIFAVGGSEGDFFNVALVNGELAVRMRQNGETLFTHYDPSTRGYSFCDGEWHTINVNKAKNIIALIVDDDLVTPIEEGDLENRNCNTNGALFVGGIPDGVAIDGLLTETQYTGCIRKMRIDFHPINPHTAMSVHGDITTNSCPLL